MGFLPTELLRSTDGWVLETDGEGEHLWFLGVSLAGGRDTARMGAGKKDMGLGAASLSLLGFVGGRLDRQLGERSSLPPP